MISKIGREAVGEVCYQAIYDRSEKCDWCVLDKVCQGEYIEYELTNPRDYRIYSVTNSPLHHSEGPVSKLTIFRDITDIKAVEKQLYQARKMESIGTLAGGIAHDFNNLLYMILGNAELAMDDIPKWNPVHAHLEEIRVASLKAAGIVKQLLNSSRASEPTLQPIGAVTVIKDTLKLLRSTIPSTIEIQNILPDTEITILADSIQIEQALINICINAAQAMEEMGGVIEIRVEMVPVKGSVVLKNGNYLKITIRDSGPGIDPGIVERIFDPYFTTKDIGKGSGMGLSVVMGIVKNHGGTISVDSVLEKGTCFTLLFPVVGTEPPLAIDAILHVPHGNERILFVDDETSIANMAQTVLERLGYQVEIRTDPVAALALFQSDPHRYDLVITDMTMPRMTGVSLSHKLIEIRPDIPVILCTGHNPKIDAEKASAMGIAAYVMKPIVKEEIAGTIRKVLDNKESPRR